MSESLGAYLKKLRDQLDWSTRQVEEKMVRLQFPKAQQVSRSYLSQIERGVVNIPGPAKLLGLAKVYHVPYEDLMARAGYLGDKIKAQPFEGIRNPKLVQMMERMGAMDLTEEELSSVELALRYIAEQRHRGKGQRNAS